MTIASNTRAAGRVPKYDANVGLIGSSLAIVPQGSAGAPSSGTWIRGTLVIDSADVLWQCTVSGTPGTWARIFPAVPTVDGLTYTPRGTTGPPTSGTWAAGAIVMDSAKVFWKCTVAGTPGTWVDMLTSLPPTDALPAGTSMFLPLVSSVADTSGNSRTTAVQGSASYGGSPARGTGAAKISYSPAFQVLISESTLFNCGTGDWTVAFWMRGNGTYFTNETNVPAVFSCSGAGSPFSWRITWDGSVPAWKLYPGALNMGNGGLTKAQMDTWHHYAFVRASGVIKLYVDGVYQSQASYASAWDQAVSTARIGSDRGDAQANCIDGYLQQFLFCKATAVWTANFTPPQYIAP